MATVRITVELKNDIRRKIVSDFKPLVEKHEASFKLGMTPDDFYEHCLIGFLKDQGVERQHFDLLPDAWKDSCENINVRWVNGVEIPYNFRGHRLSKPVLAPDRMRAGHGTLSVQSEALQDVADNIQTWINENNRLATEHAAFLNGVMKVLDASTTLKQAMEMWPNMVQVLPDAVLARHREPENRQKKQKVEVDADLTDALNSTLVGTKINKALG